MEMVENLIVSTSGKTYPVYIGNGIRSKIYELLKSELEHVSSFLILSDRVVAPFYLEDLTKSLAPFGKRIGSFVVPSGEEAKSINTYYDCLTCALESGLDRNSLIIALGGGVIGDLAGFVAATYMRGIPFIQVPTTLLAHDSAVGGKTAINHPLGKNMIGAFHQPEAVIYDIDTLSTLPKLQWRSGFAEMIKHAFIKDASFFEWLKDHIRTLSDLKEEKLVYALKKGIEIKANVVSIDEKESGLRAILNFGHTLGHAVEAEVGYGQITHGDAVAIGMQFALKVSEDFYHVDLNLTGIRSWMDGFGFPKLPNELSPEKLLQRMKTDKKAVAGKVRMILMRKIGHVESVLLDDEWLLGQLIDFLERGWER